MYNNGSSHSLHGGCSTCYRNAFIPDLQEPWTRPSLHFIWQHNMDGTRFKLLKAESIIDDSRGKTYAMHVALDAEWQHDEYDMLIL